MAVSERRGEMVVGSLASERQTNTNTKTQHTPPPQPRKMHTRLDCASCQNHTELPFQKNTREPACARHACICPHDHCNHKKVLDLLTSQSNLRKKQSGAKESKLTQQAQTQRERTASDVESIQPFFSNLARTPLQRGREGKARSRLSNLNP